MMADTTMQLEWWDGFNEEGSIAPLDGNTRAGLTDTDILLQ